MKNKKISVYIFTFAICLTSFSGCKSEYNSNEKSSADINTTTNVTSNVSTTNIDETSFGTETVTKPVTENKTEKSESTIQTDNSAIVSQNPDGSFNVLFVSTMCNMAFPANWAGRVFIEDSVVYSKKCSDYIAERNAGELLTIMSNPAEYMSTIIPSSFLLGTFSDEYVIAFLPTDCDYDTTITELYEEYTSLNNDVKSVIDTAKCDSSPEFSPIDMSIYDSPSMYSSSASGLWEDYDNGMQFSPYIGFRPKDGLFVYAYGLNGADTLNIKGSYCTNINSENYQWNTDNWGESGLIFIDGCVYSFTYYLSAPQTMNLEKLAGNTDDDLSSKGWVFSSDFQDFDAEYNDN